jgi:hypothetical protein
LSKSSPVPTPLIGEIVISFKSNILKITLAGALLAGLWACNSTENGGPDENAPAITYKGKLKASSFDQDTIVVDSCDLAIETLIADLDYERFDCGTEIQCERDSVRAVLNASLKSSCKVTSGGVRDTAYIATSSEAEWAYFQVDKDSYPDEDLGFGDGAEIYAILKYPYKPKIQTTIQPSAYGAFTIKTPNLKEYSLVSAECVPVTGAKFLMDTENDTELKRVTVSGKDEDSLCEVGDSYEVNVVNATE